MKTITLLFNTGLRTRITAFVLALLLGSPAPVFGLRAKGAAEAESTLAGMEEQLRGGLEEPPEWLRRGLNLPRNLQAMTALLNDRDLRDLVERVAALLIQKPSRIAEAHRFVDGHYAGPPEGGIIQVESFAEVRRVHACRRLAWVVLNALQDERVARLHRPVQPKRDMTRRTFEKGAVAALMRLSLGMSQAGEAGRQVISAVGFDPLLSFETPGAKLMWDGFCADLASAFEPPERFRGFSVEPPAGLIKVARESGDAALLARLEGLAKPPEFSLRGMQQIRIREIFEKAGVHGPVNVRTLADYEQLVEWHPALLHEMIVLHPVNLFGAIGEEIVARLMSSSSMAELRAVAQSRSPNLRFAPPAWSEALRGGAWNAVDDFCRIQAFPRESQVRELIASFGDPGSQRVARVLDAVPQQLSQLWGGDEYDLEGLLSSEGAGLKQIEWEIEETLRTLQDAGVLDDADYYQRCEAMNNLADGPLEAHRQALGNIKRELQGLFSSQAETQPGLPKQERGVSPRDALTSAKGYYSHELPKPWRSRPISARYGRPAGLEELRDADRLPQSQREIAPGGIIQMAPSAIATMSQWLREMAISPNAELALEAQGLRLENHEALLQSALQEARLTGSWTPPEGPAPVVFSFEHANTLPWAPLVAQAGAPVAVMAETSTQAEGLKDLFEGFEIPEGRYIIVPMDVAIDRDTAVEMIQQHFARVGLPVVQLVPLNPNAPHEQIEQILKEYGLRFDLAPFPRLIVVSRYLSALT